MPQKQEYGVFIGRFQPFHNAHLETVHYALERVKELVIVIGSCYAARTVKNPWTGVEREEMIRDCLTSAENARVKFVHSRDYLYNDNLWIAAIQGAISQIIEDEADDVVLFGHRKDSSSFYLKLFPHWELHETPEFGKIDATRIRDLYFQNDILGVRHLVPSQIERKLTVESIESNRNRGSKELARFAELKKEYDFLRDYHRMWENAPYPVTFNTVDACCICSGHVLLVRRKAAPGKGLFALPGGFLNQNEHVLDGAVRELREETGIKLTTQDLMPLIVDSKVFDHPLRSLRGRTVTHAFCFDINKKQNKLPVVKGMDDADKAFWMPIAEAFAREEEFFEDHIHMIRAFVNKF